MIKKWLRKWLGVGETSQLTINIVADLQKQINQIPRFNFSDPIPEDSVVYLLAMHMKAIKEHLGIEVKWEWQDDPNVAPPQKVKMRVFKAIKVTKKPDGRKIVKRKK